ncbi:peptide MFS transporter [Brochothrix campestris]|uniref:Proton-dependent oligopeptide transporter n=1 Tax=Brochothrix campestris FSL F6-1037 TaxID=1265861 RepID=W7CGJ1_9LIST|nr:peptide MFS transporter [Brochothrix campestris]EUJ36042.1 proton-dependent oligopeptide transporter [Brochothrix campestris FSL F6-1037]
MSASQKATDKGFFGHPKGLSTLFFTELWERFSYYGMRAILIFYMYYSVANGGLDLDKSTSIALMSIYGSLIYMTGVLGGWLADRVFGTRKAVFLGGVLIMVGHIVLSLPNSGITGLFSAMVLLAVGTGLLKPNVSSMIGDLYDPKDVRRAGGFSIFYMGINLGGFLAPYVTGSFMDNFHLGFLVAAVGMALGLAFFLITQNKFLGDAGKTVTNPIAKEERGRVAILFSSIAVGLLIIACVAYAFDVLTIKYVINFISCVAIILPIVYFIVMLRSKKTDSDEKSRLLAYIPLFITAVMFWMIQEQGSSVLAVFASDRVTGSFFGWTISPAFYQSFNPLFVIFLSPVFAMIWTKLGDRQPSTPRKFALGLFFAGLSFLIMMLPGILGGTEMHSASPIWLVLSFLLVTIGELCLSPVGLGVTTQLAPRAFAAQTMGVWFLSNSMAQGINAQIGQVFSADIEIQYFGILGTIAVVIGIILFIITPKLLKLMKGIK